MINENLQNSSRFRSFNCNCDNSLKNKINDKAVSAIRSQTREENLFHHRTPFFLNKITSGSSQNVLLVCAINIFFIIIYYCYCFFPPFFPKQFSNSNFYLLSKIKYLN